MLLITCRCDWTSYCSDCLIVFSEKISRMAHWSFGYMWLYVIYKADWCFATNSVSEVDEIDSDRN